MSNFFKTQLVLDKYKSVAKVKIVQHIVTNKKTGNYKQLNNLSSPVYSLQSVDRKLVLAGQISTFKIFASRSFSFTRF